MASGDAVLHVTMSGYFLEQFKDTKKADCYASDDDAGIMRIEFKKGGAFEVKSFVKGGARIVLPPLCDEMKADREAERCEVSAIEDNGFTVTFPDGWFQDAAPKAAERRPKTAAPAAVNGTAGDMGEKFWTAERIAELQTLRWKGMPASEIAGRMGTTKGTISGKLERLKAVEGTAGGLLDAVSYLRVKGHKCSRLAAGRWQLNGDTVQSQQILALINTHRAKMDLPPLSQGQIA